MGIASSLIKDGKTIKKVGKFVNSEKLQNTGSKVKKTGEKIDKVNKTLKKLGF